MQVTRLSYLASTTLLLALNGTALWVLARSSQPQEPIVQAALIINLISWPLALVVAYRTGQATAHLYLQRMKT
jgi:hypothetical protein